MLNRFAADSLSGSPSPVTVFASGPTVCVMSRKWSRIPNLRSEAARIRDRMRDVRVDLRRHSKAPQWPLVEEMIAQPLRELKRNVQEELIRRSAERNALVPIDRDPVPDQFTDAVRQYYENLGEWALMPALPMFPAVLFPIAETIRSVERSGLGCADVGHSGCRDRRLHFRCGASGTTRRGSDSAGPGNRCLAEDGRDCVVGDLFVATDAERHTSAAASEHVADLGRQQPEHAAERRRREQSRGEKVLGLLNTESDWRVRLAQAFDVRDYAFDARLERIESTDELALDGYVSSLSGSLQSLAERFTDRPVAGVMLFTDGNLTDTPAADFDWSKLGFPVYPVLPNEEDEIRDLRIADVSVRQTDFESAPTTVRVQVDGVALGDTKVFVQLRDQASGNMVEEKSITIDDGDQTQEVRFRFRPEQTGISFYQIVAFTEDDRKLFESADDRRPKGTHAKPLWQTIAARS